MISNVRRTHRAAAEAYEGYELVGEELVTRNTRIENVEQRRSGALTNSLRTNIEFSKSGSAKQDRVERVKPFFAPARGPKDDPAPRTSSSGVARQHVYDDAET